MNRLGAVIPGSFGPRGSYYITDWAGFNITGSTDDGYWEIPLGFGINILGTNYRTAYVSTNG